MTQAQEDKQLKYIDFLVKENTELKKQIETLKFILDMDNNELVKENAELKKQDKICEEIIIGEQIEIDRLNKENKELKAQIEKMKLDQKTVFDKGMKHLAKELKEYDRINGVWTDYFEHTVNKVLKWELERKGRTEWEKAE